MYIINIIRHNRCRRQILAGNSLEKAEIQLQTEARLEFMQAFANAEYVAAESPYYRDGSTVVELRKLDESGTKSKIYPVPAFGAEFEVFSTGAAIMRLIDTPTCREQRAKFLETFGENDFELYSSIKGFEVGKFSDFIELNDGIMELEDIPVLICKESGVAYVCAIPKQGCIRKFVHYCSNSVPFRKMK